MRIGAHYLGDGRCEFAVWSPLSKDVKVRISSPASRTVPMSKDECGYWRASVEGISPGALYGYELADSPNRPDPASNFQPQGVHGPSQVVDHNIFKWEDEDWSGLPLEKMIAYELHVGAFTHEGTFEAIINRLDDLKELGVNAIELMPVAQFPGERNWGYDGVYPFAVQNSYGGPEGLKAMVNACHRAGVAVILDVVYNHIGPEGNYLENFAPYFTEKYRTPWGKAINFDDAYSYGVRNCFIENALYWFRDYHIDALRLDAIHAIWDMSAKHILEELAEEVAEFSLQQGREFFLIAESDLNDARVIRPRDEGGYGIQAQWSDDFHHSLHTLLTGELRGYYSDFGKIEHLVKAYSDGFVYDWQYSKFRKRHHGSSSIERPARQFFVFSQNHDQVGNRMMGERLTALVSFEALKLAAGAMLLSPFVPMLFMGEEYGEESPFLYFVSHGDANLIEAVRKGRRAEFREFAWKGEPPDPQDEETFFKSKLKWEKRTEGKHRVLRDFYRNLIALRREIPALTNLSKDDLEVSALEGESLIVLRRWHEASHILSIMNFNETKFDCRTAIPQGRWKKIMESSEERWNGPGSSLPETITQGEPMLVLPLSFALYEMEVSS